MATLVSAVLMVISQAPPIGDYPASISQTRDSHQFGFKFFLITSTYRVAPYRWHLRDSSLFAILHTDPREHCFSGFPTFLLDFHKEP